MIRCFAALSEVGLRDTKDIVILLKPVEATHNHFFEKLTNIAGQGYWVVGRRYVHRFVMFWNRDNNGM